MLKTLKRLYGRKYIGVLAMFPLIGVIPQAMAGDTKGIAAANPPPQVIRNTTPKVMDPRSCKQAKRELEDIESRMRKGYRGSESTRLKQKRDQHEEYYRRYCRQ